MEKNDTRLREHLANERTFLAWVRTALALIGLGFVIVKFALFLKELTLLFEKNNFAGTEEFSTVIGIVIVAFGVLLPPRSEERRVGKECRSRGSWDYE